MHGGARATALLTRTRQRHRNDRRPVADPRRAQELAVELETYTALVKVKMPLQVLYFSEDPPPDIDAQRRSDRICDRLTVLSALLR